MVKKLQVLGTIEAVNTVEIGAQVSGQIKQLFVNDGDRVKTGDILAQVNPEIAQAEFNSAQAAFDSAKLRLQVKKNSQKTLAIEVARLKRLLNADAVAQREIRQATETYENNATEILILEKDISLQANQVAKARQNLSLTTIRAPIDGIVVNTLVKAGQTLSATQSTPVLMKVVNLDTMEIKIKLSEVELLKVKQGMPVFYSPLHGKETEQAKAFIHRVIPVPMNDNNATNLPVYQGIIKVNSPPDFAHIGMPVTVSIILEPERDILLISNNAKFKHVKNHTYQVQVQQAEKWLTKQITLGELYYPYIEVVNGLSEGEKVLLMQGSTKP